MMFVSNVWSYAGLGKRLCKSRSIEVVIVGMSPIESLVRHGWRRNITHRLHLDVEERGDSRADCWI